MPSDRNLTPEQELQALKAENAKLKKRNSELYRDCVAFAKLIKAGAQKEEEINELQREIILLRSQVDTLKQTSYSNFTPGFQAETYTPVFSNSEKKPVEEYEDISSSDTYVPEQNEAPEEPSVETSADTVTYNPRVHYIDQETFEQQNMDNFDDIDNSKPKKQRVKNAGGTHKGARIAVSALLVLSILVTVLSGIGYLFSTTYKNYTVMGYRIAAVTNNAMTPEINMSDAVLVKYCGFEGLEIDSLVVTTNNIRSVARITDLAVSDGIAIATVEDKKETYEINSGEFVGKVTMTIPLLGSIIHYASANSYNYMAITVSITLFLIACLLLIPDNKPKRAKFGVDYTAEEFTI